MNSRFTQDTSTKRRASNHGQQQRPNYRSRHVKHGDKPFIKSRMVQHVCGKNAVTALLKNRPHDAISLHCFHRQDRQWVNLLNASDLAMLPLSTHTNQELVKMAKVHDHEGIVVAAKPLAWTMFPFSETDHHLSLRETPALWLGIDGAVNPHHLGTMLRVSAFFGLTGLVVSLSQPFSAMSATTLRVAQGAAEYLQIYGTQKLPQALRAFRRMGYVVIGLEANATEVLENWLHEAPVFNQAVVVVGSEHHGISHAVKTACHQVCRLRSKDTILKTVDASVASALSLSLITERITEHEKTAESWSTTLSGNSEPPTALSAQGFEANIEHHR